MRICVTGGSGVLGRAVVSDLLSRGIQVRVLDLKEPVVFRPTPSQFEYIRGSVLDYSALLEAVKECDAAVHLVAKLPQSHLDEQAFWDINVVGTMNLAHACTASGVKRMVFASTIEIYGAQAISVPLAEDAEKLFTGHYSHNKWECEQKLLEHQSRFGLEVSFLRMPMIMGPGFYNEKSVIGMFNLLKRNLPMPLPAPDMLVSFVSSSDCAQAFWLASTKPGAVGEAFNIAALDTPTLTQFMKDLIDLAGSRSKTIVPPSKLVEIGLKAGKFVAKNTTGKLAGTPVELLDFVLTGGAYSIEKARSLLGYDPQFTCAQSWYQTYKWYWEQHRSIRPGS
ncbi:MAG: NAD(P)-dependent oxidoreductase [Actinobacteria bacterium]|jgi:nucleoside-diphosphate-sugar epimerase|nr:NAD(P)-dependent oxidoreductase [Actinomycetota bacterium]MCL6104444.1 NAD(P)-dependent oxidoreductase [Actinomycetota bacterium]